MSWLLTVLWVIAAQGEVAMGDAWLGFILNSMIFNIALDMGLALLYTSVCDMVFSGDDEARWRRGINMAFWTLASASVLLVVCATVGSLAGADASFSSAVKYIGIFLRSVTFLYSSVFMVIAHRKMHVVSKGVRNRGEVGEGEDGGGVSGESAS